MLETKKRGRKPLSATKLTGQVQSLARGLTILELLAEAEKGATLSDISLQVGLAVSTTHRLLNTLEQNGYVYNDNESTRWTIGVKTFTIGNAYLNSRDIVSVARHYLRELMEQAGETANLSILGNNNAILIAQVECHEMMRMMVPLGSRLPLHASGAGKALLAMMTHSQVASILQKQGLTKFTEQTIVIPSKLREALAETRKNGYAYDNEEHAIGLRCIAAPVFDEHNDPIAAISISGPRDRITDNRIPQLGQIILNAAIAITKQIGGKLQPIDKTMTKNLN